MQLLVYILIYPFLYLISLLPFRLFYIVSDGICFVLYRIIGYRKKTVTQNLNLVFPEKSKDEINTIRRQFYMHLCDLFLEMIKSISISKEQLNKRFIIKNPEELKRLERLNKSIVVMYGHYASYEWSLVTQNYLTYKGYGIYKKIANPYFDNLAKKIRSKYNTTLIHSKKAIKEIMALESRSIKILVGFLSDQSPKDKPQYYWTHFMNIEVPCFTGAETIAKKLDFSVTFLKIKKIKRGFYEAEFIPLADNANEFKDFEITKKFYQQLELQIKEAPQYYLWTHKRWKHRKNLKT